MLQFKVHHAVRHLVLPQVAMGPHPHMEVHHNTHKHSQHMAATQATHPLQQLQHTQAMVAATLKLVRMVATHRHQQLHMAVRHPTAVLALVGMTPMVPKGSRHMGVQVDMGAKEHSPALSQQLVVVVVSGRSSQTMKVDHTTTTRSQASVNGTAQPICEAAQPQLQPQNCYSRTLAAGSTGQATLITVVPGILKSVSCFQLLITCPSWTCLFKLVLDACSGMQCLAAMLGVRCLMQVCQMPECLVRCHIEVLDA